MPLGGTGPFLLLRRGFRRSGPGIPPLRTAREWMAPCGMFTIQLNWFQNSPPEVAPMPAVTVENPLTLPKVAAAGDAAAVPCSP